MTNKYNTVLYIGVTNDLARRVYEHKNKPISGFTNKYNIYKLIYYEVHEDSYNAISREKTLKNLLRRKKMELIRKINPCFEELPT